MKCFKYVATMKGKLHYIISLLLIIFYYGDAQFLTPIEISDAEESFVRGRTEYLFLNIRVVWSEALIICESYKNGSLAIVNSIKKAEFLSVALSETNMELEHLWIGARAAKGKEGFVWINNGSEYIPDDSFIERGMENFENATRDCLTFSRKFHEDPFYINLECSLRRPFICERPYKKIYNGSMTTPNWIVIGKYKYGIFFDRRTWRESVNDCRKKHRAHLASFRTDNEITTVGKFLLVGRPSLENAWIGGRYDRNSWRFIYDDSPLREHNGSLEFPPWRPDREIKREGCLLLDRHLANHPIFLEARCQRKRSYICTKPLRDTPDYSIVIIQDIGYVIYYTKKSWYEAFEQCKHIEANLVKVIKENIHDVAYIMGENVTEVNHIWIGGKLSANGDYFYWVVDEEPIPQNNIDISHYPPWYDNIYDKDYACLNMDRENHNRPMFYGAACDAPQSFICEQHNTDKLPEGEAIKVVRKNPENKNATDT